MKKAFVFILLLVCVITVFPACTTTADEASLSSAQIQSTATIVEVSKYGNVYLGLPSQIFLEAFSLGDLVTVQAGDQYIIAPVATSYSDVDSSDPLVKVDGDYVEVALSYADFAGTYSVGAGDDLVITMYQEGGYLAEYEIRHLERSESREDYASDEIFANFRPLSGGQLKENFLYRSCNPALDDARAPYADALAEKAGIRTVVNLADSEESLLSTMDPDSYYAGLYNDGQVVLLNMGIDFRSADFASKLKTGLEFIISHPEGPVLIHCNEGKDRAGMVSALLEALAGASMDEIIADYMTSYVNYYNVEPGSLQYGTISSIITDFFIEINGRPFPLNSLQQVTEVYLVNTVGLTEAQVESLKAVITE